MEIGYVAVSIFFSSVSCIEVSLLQQEWKIGMVREGNTGFYTEQEVFYKCNLTYYWYSVDVDERFQTLRIVHELEIEHKVDMVVVLHDGMVDNSAMLPTVPLIHWGRKPEYIVQGIVGYKKKIKQLATQDMCHVVESKRTKEPFCLNNTEVFDILRAINGATRFRIKVELRGPSVLSAIVIGNLKWKEVIIFHEDETEHECSELVYSLSNGGVKVIVYNIDEVVDLSEVLLSAYLNTVPAKSSINFVVLCKFQCLRRLLHVANDFDNINTKKTMLKHFSRWLISSFDYYGDVRSTLRDCANDLDNIAVIAFPRLTTDNPEARFRKALHKTILGYVIADDTMEELPGNADNGFQHRDIKEKITTELKREANGWRSVDQCEGIRIDTLMWTHKGRDFNLVGYVWKRGELLIYADLFPNTKHGYNGRTFLISTLHFSPFVIKTEVNGTAHYGGICMDLLVEFARRLNFTYNLTEPPDQTWGRPGPNNTFNGMIGQLQREEIDIVAADTSIQKEREMVMDFMFPFYYGYTSVLLKKPDPNASKWRTLVDPLTWKVLMTIGICVPVVSLILSLLEKCNPYYIHLGEVQENTATNDFQSFTHALWYMYGALLAQGSVHLPQTVAGRTMVCCWWLFSIVIVGTYCGNLIAFLTVTKDKPPFETLNEMADMKGTYRWGLQGGTNREHVFETSKRPEFRRVGDAIQEFSSTDPTVLATDFDVQMVNVNEGNYGWIGDAVVMEIEIAKDCDLMMIKDKFLPLRYAFGFTNNSPHVQIFTKQMLIILETGLVQVWKRKWWPKSNAVCAGSIVAEAKPISIIDVQSAFYVAAGGALLGLCVFFVEVLVGICRNLKSKMKQPEKIQNERDNKTQ